MIKLSEHKTALVNIDTTVKALEDLNRLISTYKVDLPGPAYCSFHYVGTEDIKVQFNRKKMVELLKEQRQQLVDYLATLGIDASDYRKPDYAF